MEMILIGEADIKVESEEFCDAKDDQANYNGTRWNIICLSTVLMLYKFYCFFYNLFYVYIFIPIKYGSLYSAVFMCFLCSRRRNGIRLWWNWCEGRAFVSFIGMWPGLFCVLYGLIFVIDLIYVIYLKPNSYVNKYHPLLKSKYYH